MTFLTSFFCFGDTPRATGTPATRGQAMTDEAVGPMPGTMDCLFWGKKARGKGKNGTETKTENKTKTKTKRHGRREEA